MYVVRRTDTGEMLVGMEWVDGRWKPRWEKDMCCLFATEKAASDALLGLTYGVFYVVQRVTFSVP